MSQRNNEPDGYTSAIELFSSINKSFNRLPIEVKENIKKQAEKQLSDYIKETGDNQTVTRLREFINFM